MELWDKWKVPLVIVAALIVIGIVWATYANAADKGGDRPSFLPIGEVVDRSNWNGVYGGLHGGYGWSAWHGNMIYTDEHEYPDLVFDDSNKNLDGEGAVAGGQIGFNIQSGKIVWGLEADASWTDISGSEVFLPFPDNPGSPAWGFKNRIDWLATVRGRIGVAAGNVLIYGTAGVAFAEVDSRLEVFSTGPANAGHIAYGAKNETKTGWTVGGGLEWMLSKNWSFKGEYLYTNLGEVGGILPGQQTTSCNSPCPHTTDGFSGDLDIHMIRAGLNFRLN